MSTAFIRQSLLAGATLALGYWLGQSARPPLISAAQPASPAACSLDLDLVAPPELPTDMPNYSVSISDLTHHLDLAAEGTLDEQDLTRLFPSLSDTDLLMDFFSTPDANSYGS